MWLASAFRLQHSRPVLTRGFVALLTCLGLGSLAVEPERSVIQILNFSQRPAWDAPWRFEDVQRSGGSGFVIKGKRIMTNAHVVSWARQLVVRRYQNPRPYVAEVEFIAHDCDLAILRVADETFFKDLEPLEFGELPVVRSTVVTMGYPAGGEEIAYTRGVVSRIERQVYAHSGLRQFLAVQTDAAINPGNSGGPVIQENKAVGVAFQGRPGLENAGFFIPPPIVEHFLKDIEDGKYDGFPMAGVSVMPLQNPAYRRWLKLPENNLGTRIDGFNQLCGTNHWLRPDDVLLQIGPYPIANDGSILLNGNRVDAGVAFNFAQMNESVQLRLWRDGAEVEFGMPLRVCQAGRGAGFQYDLLPRYLVYAGLVFTPLSLDYLRSAGIDPSDPAHSDLVYELRFRPQESPGTARPEPIMLASVLPDVVNANFGVRGRAFVDRINGVRIERLEDVIRAFEGNQQPFDVFEFAPHRTVECLQRSGLAEANEGILKKYAIAQDRRL